MKKAILSIAFAFVAIFAQAQDYTRDSLFMNITSPDGDTNVVFNFPTFMEMRDNTVLMGLPLRSQNDNHCLGDWFYKISPQTNAVLDSVFIETDDTFIEDDPLSSLGQNTGKGYIYNNGSRFLLAQNPEGEGYVSAKLVFNRVTSSCNERSTWLRISHFDENLNFQDHDDAVMVHIEDTIVDRLCSITLEGDNIVLMYLLYGKWDSPIIARVGLDGTLKEKADFQNLFWFNNPHRFYAMGIFNDSPREYVFYDLNPQNMASRIRYHVIDSLFVYKESFVMEEHYGDIYVAPASYTENFQQIDFMPLDDGTFLEVRQYERHNLTRNGACIMKYDKTTHGYLANALFDSWPIYSASSKYGYPIGLKQSNDGYLYFAYRTNANTSENKGWIGIAKLDTDLNIIWQRYCLGSYTSSMGYLHTYIRMNPTEDGFVIGGKIHKEGEPYNFFFYFIHDNDANGIHEAEDFLRPYMYYPNPARDQLHLQYSPDVTPAKIELYDLQGRLVRSQRHSLESLDMHGLSAGQYLMKVTLEDGKTFTDKVAKE